MSDQTPGDPYHETPAPGHRDGDPAPGAASDYGAPGHGAPPGSGEWPTPDGPPLPPAGSTWGGVRALLLIIAGMIGVELFLYAAARLLDGARWGESFNSSQLLIWLGALIATIVAIVKLPPKSRTAFLASCGILFGAVFILLIVTCGIIIMQL